jgi:hypothetical protein
MRRPLTLVKESVRTDFSLPRPLPLSPPGLKPANKESDRKASQCYQYADTCATVMLPFQFHWIPSVIDSHSILGTASPADLMADS